MCLRVVTKKIRKPTADVAIAWKVFCEYPGDGGGLRSIYKQTDMLWRYKTWYTAKPERFHGENYVPYFHAFVTRAAARKYKMRFAGEPVRVKKVLLRFVTVEGEQIDQPALVAKEMLILPSTKG